MTTRSVAIVTAAGSGIGAACARELARRDYALVLMSRTATAAAVADEIGGIALEGSVTETADLERLVAAALDGESAAGALGRLQAAGDPRLVALAEAARAREEVRDLSRREPVTKRARTRELAYRLMTDFSKARAREGESAEEAMGRLMGEGDEDLRNLYQIYAEA